MGAAIEKKLEIQPNHLIRVLLADSDPFARERIDSLLKDDPDIEIVGECSTGYGAVAAINELDPDLILLDVNMPQMDGFRILEAVDRESPPLVIFVATDERHAFRAFEASAIDFLLKPLDRERFKRSVTRAKTYLQLERDNAMSRRILACLEELQPPPKYLTRFVVRHGGNVVFINVEDVDWIETEGHYIRLHCGKQSHLLRESLSNLESQLDPERFLRIHRSTIVRSDRIQKLEPLFHGDCNVTLKDGTQLMLSRNYRKNISGL